MCSAGYLFIYFVTILYGYDCIFIFQNIMLPLLLSFASANTLMLLILPTRACCVNVCDVYEQ